VFCRVPQHRSKSGRCAYGPSSSRSSDRLLRPDLIEFGQINVFIGPNNAGKSSILRAVYSVQHGPQFADVRLDALQSQVELVLADVHGIRPWGPNVDFDEAKLVITATTNVERNGGQITLNLTETGRNDIAVNPLPAKEPDHFIVPYLSRRKAVAYQEDVSEQYALAISPNFDNLAAKLSRLGNFAFPAGERYRETCQAVLGFVVTAVPSVNGQRPGVYLPDRRVLPLDQMGEGVPNIAGLLADLALSEGKAILIEEPENDLHPRALKALLDLIEESAQLNQIFVSTHSNIVARHLGAANDSRFFYVDTEQGALPPVATVRPVAATPEARLAVLRDLGYSFSDFDLWDGWLILEESSAERIIRDYLIPWFAPRLARIRTLAAGGNTEVEPTFEDFNRLVRFTHLEEAYRNAAWVRVDGDEAGSEIVARLRARFPTWQPDRFGCFDRAQFERYYPAEFNDRVDSVLAETDRRRRRDAKRALLKDVREWLDAEAERGRTALAESAKAVITELKTIEAQLSA
jgi:hypothetical protein